MSLQSHKKSMRETFEQEIISAAGEEFGARGLEAFSLRQLAQRLGCSPGTLYLYFKSKEDLLQAVVEQSFDRLRKALEGQPKTGDLLADLRQWFHAYMEFGLGSPNEYRCAFILPSVSRVQPYRPHAAFDLLRSHVRTGIESGAFRNKSVDEVAQVIWAGVHGLTSLLIARPAFPWVERTRLANAMADALIESLLVPPEIASGWRSETKRRKK
jgi:AcrR family transcriptional regulator